MIKSKIISLFVVVVLFATLIGCSGGTEKNTEFVLLEGQFAETDIVMQMAGILIDEYTDLDVSFHDSMNTVAASNALIADEVDLYNSYDGTLLTTILGYDPSDVPEGEDLFEWTIAKGSEDKGLTLLGKFGFENTYALGIQRTFAEENNIKTISDLKPFAPDLVFVAEHEFFDEEGTMRFNPFIEHYDIEWKDSFSVDMGLKYAAIENDNADVIMIYSTDGLNKKFDLAILEDDLSFFPQYYGSYIMRDTLFEEYEETAPNLEEVLSRLVGLIDNETMIEMNYAVDAEGEKSYDVAKKFLVENGLLE
jgi:osmoprotectant transport system substrate-binding protein